MQQPLVILNASSTPRVKVLVIYTGGTLGMVYENGQLIPFSFEDIINKIPEIKRLDFEITFTSTAQILDSSNVGPQNWVEMANIVYQNYNAYDSFVILHGTDTMAYSASALSFMLENLSKPVIFTGAQLPIGVARTDARENIITALEIAAAQINDSPIVPEVSLYFQNMLLRGNRAKKKETSQFNAFRSENYPPLAEVGVTIEYNFPYISSYNPEFPLRLNDNLDTNVVVLKLFPGINQKVVNSILNIENLKAVVLETYGAGNAPTANWFLDEIKTTIEKGILVANVSQCDGGRVIQGKYQTSSTFNKIGVLGASDMTIEATVTKLMYLLGEHPNIDKVKSLFQTPICGEMSLI